MDSSRVENLSHSVTDPQALLNADTFLDCMQALIREISINAFKNNKCVDAFLKRYRKEYETLERYRVGTSDFTVVQVLGKGAFGEVKLVRHNASEKVYAMKCILKSEMLTRPEGISSFWEERHIMAFSNSDWIVRCHWAFQDVKYLYMVMDYMPGGDLLSGILDNENLIITEELIRFYTAEIILAIEALHNMGFAHRDIKPDNCLINAKGHLKVTDFGTAIKVDPSDGQIRCSTAVGTPDYISPEVLKSQSCKGVYGRECDWWSFGVVVYEMKYQDTPFYDETLVKTYSRINSHVDTIEFPPDEEGYEPASPEIMDLIEKCLIADRTKRLGYRGARELKLHSFFNKKLWTWENIHTYPAPFDPKISSEIDTKHFKYEPPTDTGRFNPGDIQQKSQFTGEQLPFVGFSYCPEIFSRLSSGAESSSEGTAALKKQLDDALKSVERFQNSYNKAEVSRGQVESENNDLKRKLAKIEVENQSYSKKFEDVSSKLHTMRWENAAHKTELEHLRTENKKLKNDSGDRLNQLEAEKVSLTESLNFEKNKSAESNKKIADFEKRLKDIQNRWERECNENKNLMSDLESRQKEFDAIYNELSACQIKIGAYEDKTKSQTEEIERLKKQDQESKNAFEEKSKEYSDLARNYEQMKVRSEQDREKIADLTQEIENLNQKTAASDEESDELNSVKKQLNTELDAKKSLIEKVRVLEQEVSQLKYDLNVTKEELDTTKEAKLRAISKNEELNDKVALFKGEKNKLVGELKFKTTELENSKSKEVTLTKELGALKESKKFLEAEKIRIEQELESLKQTAREAEDECESFRMKLTLLSNKIEDLRDDKSDLEKENEEVGEKLKHIESEKLDLETKVSEKETLVANLEKEVMDLKQDLQLAKISDQEAQEKLKFEIEKKSEEITDLRNMVENDKVVKTDLCGKIKIHYDEIQELQNKLQAKLDENSTLKQEKQKLITKFSDFVNQGGPDGKDNRWSKRAGSVIHPEVEKCESDRDKKLLKEKEKQLRKFEMELDAHKQNARKYENEINHVRHEIDSVKLQYENLDKEYNDLKKENMKLMDTIRSMESPKSRNSSNVSGANLLDSVHSIVNQSGEYREGKLEIQQSQIMGFLNDSKKSKKTQKFIVHYAVMESKSLYFYKSADDKSARKNPTQVVDLTKLIHVRNAQHNELFREKKEDVEQKVFQIVFSQEEGLMRKKDDDVIFEWAAHQMRDYTGNLSNLTCDACNKPFKSTTFTLRSNAVAVIECKHCSKKYHKDRWDEEKLQMHKCPLANKANDTVMYLKAENQQDRADWIKELNKYCAPRSNKQLTLNPSMRNSFSQPPHFSSGSTSSSGASGGVTNSSPTNGASSDTECSGGSNGTIVKRPSTAINLTKSLETHLDGSSKD